MNPKQLQELKKKMIAESGLYRDIEPSSIVTAPHHQGNNNHDNPI
jgi:hypothetical protein